MSAAPVRSGADELRLIVHAMDVTREDFNQRFSASELITIYRAFLACGWDICPDQWTEAQVKAALRGVAPRWDDDERPIEEGT